MWLNGDGKNSVYTHGKDEFEDSQNQYPLLMHDHCAPRTSI